jgi:Flp pilus assembly pilin Flp
MSSRWAIGRDFPDPSFSSGPPIHMLCLHGETRDPNREEKDMFRIRQWVKSFLKCEQGKIPVEYAVALALIAGAIAMGVQALTTAANNQNNATSNMLTGGSGS